MLGGFAIVAALFFVFVMPSLTSYTNTQNGGLTNFNINKGQTQRSNIAHTNMDTFVNGAIKNITGFDMNQTATQIMNPTTGFTK